MTPEERDAFERARMMAIGDLVAEAVRDARADLIARGITPSQWKFPPDADDLAGIVKDEHGNIIPPPTIDGGSKDSPAG
jgi:hypothetical protein